MNSSTFRNLSRLLERWPVDPQKKGRDFGEYFRKHIAKSFAGNPNQSELHSWDEIHSILSRIASNQYTNAYPVNQSASSTGLSAKDASAASSTEFLQFLEEEEAQRKGVKKFIPRVLRKNN